MGAQGGKYKLVWANRASRLVRENFTKSISLKLLRSSFSTDSSRDKTYVLLSNKSSKFQSTTSPAAYSSQVISPEIGGAPFNASDLRSACFPKPFIDPVSLGIHLGLFRPQYEALSGSSSCKVQGWQELLVSLWFQRDSTTPNIVILPPAILALMIYRAPPRTILPDISPQGCVCMQLASRVTIYPRAASSSTQMSDNQKTTCKN